MNDHTNPSASRLLRDATDDLAVDTEQIVQGGIARGRTIQRRRRVGTTVAAAAVVGVIGVAASVGPGLLGDDPRTGDGPGLADGTTATSSPLASPPTTPPVFTPAPRQPDAAIAIGAELIPTVIGEKLDDGGDVGEPLTGEPYGIADEPERKVVHFLYDGTLTTFTIERADTLATCAGLVDPADQPDGQPAGECVIADGIETLSWGPDTADGVTGQGVMSWQHGYVVSALSYNSADGKDTPVVTDVPPISLGDLLALTTDDVWFDLESSGEGDGEDGADRSMLAATQIPALVTAVEPGDVVPSVEAGGYLESPSDRTAHVLLNGMLVSAGISTAAQGDPMARCLDRFPQPRSTCRELDDGVVVAEDDTFAAIEDGGAQAASAYLFSDTYDVFVTSYNAAAPTGAEVLSSLPPITHAELEQIVTSDGWVTG